MDDRELINIAEKAMRYAYAPYSKFKVGAAILTNENKVYYGCNIENSSYGGTVCAERIAIFKAVSEGERKISKIAIVSSSNDLTYPCGICRQILAEFMPEGKVILKDKEGGIKSYTVDELMPYRFTLD